MASRRRTRSACLVVTALAALAIQLSAVAARAQLIAGNDAGVAMGHLHYHVADIEANRTFWLGLGGEPGELGDLGDLGDPGELGESGEPGARGGVQSVVFPGVVIVLSEGQSAAEASVIDHVAFRVRSLAEVAARGFDLEMIEAYPGIASIYTPDGDRVELFEEGTATNIGFDLAEGVSDEVAERHNRPLEAPIVTHHVHFYVPADQVAAARDWYVTRFGATPGQRWRYDAADLPGFNLNFSATDSPRSATRGQGLDHIGFEVTGLEAFCRRLEAEGLVFDQPYRRISDSLALAVLTDPWGTTIELTEGLGNLLP